MSILDNWSRHATASEQMKLLGESDYHQKAGYNFMQNFPNTPEWLANSLATGYQYGTEGLKSLYNPFDNYTFSDAMSRAAEEARLNKLGIKGEGFDINEYTDFINKFDTAYDNKPILNVQNQEPVTLGFSYSGYPAHAEVPTDMILPQRKPEDDLMNYNEHYEMPTENVNPSLIDRGKEVIGTGKDAIRNAINLGLGSITGIPFVGSALDFIGNQFEYRPAEIYTDEYGRVYNPEALDRANARGGWYTEPARASRRRDKSIDWMEKRKAAGKSFSEKNLAKLQEQQRQEEAARQSAAAAIQASNRDRGIGGYQSSWGGDSDFMEGPAGREAFSGDTDLSGYMGST